MRKIYVILTILLAIAAHGMAQDVFNQYFLDKTLRIDYYRIGNAKKDTTVLSKYTTKTGRWSGSARQLTDPFDNGKYRIVVKDANTHTVIYSRYYNTLFREYAETKEGKEKNVKYEEVANIPMPKGNVDIELQERGTNQTFITTSVFHFDKHQIKTETQKYVPCIPLERHGNSHIKIDVAIVPEGYSKSDSAKMRKDLETFKEFLFVHEPFKSRREDFNVWGVECYGEESGITDPTKGITVNSAIGASYNTYGAERYLMTFELFKLHDQLRNTPCDHVIIMANDSTYGGGAIYNFYAVSSLHPMAKNILTHELGHSIGGLADEYVDDEISYSDMHKTSTEPEEPNLTTLIDFKSKWQEMVAPDTPIPTPDNYNIKEGTTGVYEGGGYQRKNIYRPLPHCMMRDYAPFCPVCTKRLNEIFDLYTQ